jgi:regulator of protease activity HflC (stomatin/prohibitin superfamily)
MYPFEFSSVPILLLILLGTAIISIKIVPQQECWIIERLGKYHRMIEAGLHVVIPFIEKIAYKHSLKERAIDISEQAAITKDNVTLLVNTIIYVKITSPFNASYGVENPYYAVTQLAQTSMRSAIGKLMLDNTFEARELLNAQIVKAINEASESWGIKCMRHEIRDINPPANILKSMEMQVAAERQKRAVILESEGQKMSMINVAEGKKQEVVLNSEATMTEQVNSAKGEAESIQLVAQATAESIMTIANAISSKGGENAVSLKVAEKYIDAFKELAKENNTMLIPSDVGNVSSVVSQILGTYNQIKNTNKDSK